MNTQPPPNPLPILKRLRIFLTRAAPARCTWSGEHSGPPVAAVTIARTCGHHEGTPTPTCTKHLNGLISTHGTATARTPCSTCGHHSAPYILDTHELH